MNEKYLSEREAAVLGSLVYEYISTGRPVGSRSFVQKYSFTISPATMRNIMFDLEAMGFLIQPHSSAGRVPTDKGYRYYVDTLLNAYQFIMDEKTRIREEYLRREVQLDKVFVSVTKMLSLISNYAGLVLTPKSDFAVIKHIELVPLDSNEILVILVTRTGIVLNRKVVVSESLTQDELHKFSKFLTSELGGFAFYFIKENVFNTLRSTASHEFYLAIDIAELAFSVEEEPDLHVEGIENILHIPEMTEQTKLKDFLHLMEEKLSLKRILENQIRSEGVTTLIGHEIGDSDAEGCSIVVSPYKIGNRNVGVLGVLGPTRMDYKKVVPLVDYTGKVLSELLTKMSK